MIMLVFLFVGTFCTSVFKGYVCMSVSVIGNAARPSPRQSDAYISYTYKKMATAIAFGANVNARMTD